MSKDKEKIVAAFSQALADINNNIVELPGLASLAHYDCLARQLFDSRRRIEYVFHIRDAKHCVERRDPNSELFDPLRAAVLHSRSGDIDEAVWLTFIAVHFGKHSTQGWSLARKIYGRLGGPGRWDWSSVSASPQAFRQWLQNSQHHLRGERFSNHRKYESLQAGSSGTAAVFESYVNWIRPYGDQRSMIKDIHRRVGQNPHDVFDFMYRSMTSVYRFGRLGRFDFLTMLGKLGISPIEPGSAYLWHNATGPKKGARLLFGGNSSASITPKDLDELLMLIDGSLGVGMQALEDSLCNWQKSPTSYQYFKG
ncbi:hypothetical protein N7379_22505 [Rhizobium pusense]|uniref:alpha-glutamyl/putrescinyl thymine pyrophosphorylase clade 3 protein n=1 Tax=Agrobacterium pusense TaxID=648995 RepID=UPI00244A3149|nr:hypothetical protein [Agrobacterium pusense]MDH0117261.1 hypothetical protein [Agrobacterium pusense]